MSQKKNKRIDYALEIYKPVELQRIPATDECRHYHSDTPFPAIHAGDHLNAWVWKFQDQTMESLQRAMGGREPEPMVPVAVVESVLHDISESEDHLWYRIIVYTKLHTPSSAD